MEYDWTTFTKKILIHTDREKLFSMAATRQGMESWFLRSCTYHRPDGTLIPPDERVAAGMRYRFLWYGYDDTVYENGTILQTDDNDLFEFTFNGNGQTDMKVRIIFTVMEKGTLVSLTQYNIPVDEVSKAHWHLGCMEGWTFYLANMKSVAEGGIDLRNKDEKIKGVINS